MLVISYDASKLSFQSKARLTLELIKLFATQFSLDPSFNNHQSNVDNVDMSKYTNYSYKEEENGDILHTLYMYILKTYSLWFSREYRLSNGNYNC